MGPDLDAVSLMEDAGAPFDLPNPPPPANITVPIDADGVTVCICSGSNATTAPGFQRTKAAPPSVDNDNNQHQFIKRPFEDDDDPLLLRSSVSGANADPGDVIAATAARLSLLAAESGFCPVCCVETAAVGAPEVGVIGTAQLQQRQDDTDSFTPRVRSDKRSVTILLGRFGHFSKADKKWDDFVNCVFI